MKNIQELLQQHPEHEGFLMQYIASKVLGARAEQELAAALAISQSAQDDPTILADVLPWTGEAPPEVVQYYFDTHLAQPVVDHALALEELAAIASPDIRQRISFWASLLPLPGTNLSEEYSPSLPQAAEDFANLEGSPANAYLKALGALD